MNKFEKLIEYIINDEDDKARELFHTIVVEKSRDIYEGIMHDENESHMKHGASAEDLVSEIEVDETMEDAEESNDFSLDQEDGEELTGEFPADGEHEEHEEHEEIEDKVMNIDSKLDELLAKFDEIMGEKGEHEHTDDFDADDGEEFEPEEETPVAESRSDKAEKAKEKQITNAEDASEEKDEKSNQKNTSKYSTKISKDNMGESRKSAGDLMREYVEMVQNIELKPSDYSEGDAVGTGNKTGKTKVNKAYTGLQKGPEFGGESVDFTGENENPDNKPVPKPNNEYNKGQGNLPGAGSFKNAPGSKKVWDGKEPAFKDDGDGQGKETGKKAGAAKDGNVSVNKKPIEGAAGQPTGKKK